jgi:hypothetical protein
MNRTAVILSSLSLLALGCARPAQKPAVTTAARNDIAVVLPHPAAAEQGAQAFGLDVPGSYVVYRLSGAYREAPVTVTQRLVAQNDERVIIDVLIDDGGSQQRLRVRLGRGGELSSVARLEGDVQQPFGVAAYEQLMVELMLVADENRGVLGSTGVMLEVDGAPLAATKTSYDVRVGAHEAVLSTYATDAFPWGHVGGEIATTDGRLLYKAEVIDVGNEMIEASLAAQQSEDVYESYDDE